MSNYRVVIADDHPIVLRGLEGLFGTEHDFVVAAKCVHGEEAWIATKELKPDLLVTDKAMPHLDGIEIANLVQLAGLPTRVLLICASLDATEAAAAITSGVKGIVLKDSAPSELIDTARRVMAGERVIQQNLLDMALDAMAQKKPAAPAVPLTPRELEIVRLVAGGASNKRIAALLGVTEGTVKIHLHNIYRKLDVSNRVGLTLYVQKAGLVT